MGALDVFELFQDWSEKYDSIRVVNKQSGGFLPSFFNFPRDGRLIAICKRSDPGALVVFWEISKTTSIELFRLLIRT